MDPYITWRRIITSLSCRFDEFWTFKINILINVLNTLLEVLMWFFMAMIVDPATLGFEGIGYMPFILVGSIAIYFVDSVAISFTDSFNEDSELGVYKLAYLNNMNVAEYFTINFVVSFVFDIFVVFIPMVFAYFLLVQFSDTSTLMFMNLGNWITIFIALGIFIIGNLGLQLMTVGFTLFLKQGDPVSFFLEQFNRFFSGHVFPIALLPRFLAFLPKILPTAYVILIWRETLFLNKTYLDTSTMTLIITGLIVNIFFLVLGYVVFKYGVNRAKIEGRWF